MKNLVNEDIQNMKYLFGYKPGKVISEQAVAPASPAAPAATTPEEVIKQIQTALNTNYGAKLTVDGKWGNLTQTAFEAAVKNIKPATAGGTTPAPVAGGATSSPVVSGGTTSSPVVSGGTTSSPVVSGGTTTYTGEDVSDIVGPEKEPQLNQGSQQALSGQLTPQQIRQQARFDQRLARQARRNTRRAGQQ